MMIRVLFLFGIFLSVLSSSASAVENQLWFVTHASVLRDSAGNIVWYNGTFVNIVELDFGPSVEQVDTYYAVGMTFNPDGTCTAVPRMRWIKVPNPVGVNTEHCEGFGAHRADYLDLDGTPAFQRLECWDTNKGIHFTTHPSLGGEHVFSAFNGEAHPLNHETIDDICPEGVLHVE